MVGTTLKSTSPVNGIDLDLIQQAVAQIKENPAAAQTTFHVRTTWQNQTVSETHIESYFLGGAEIKREFSFRTDEPVELCGSNTAPNPQEYLMGALNACMSVGYVAACALNGITLEKLEIVTEGTIDLRGFFAIDPHVAPGYEALKYTVHIKGDGTPEQFQMIHEFVKKTSPNYYNLANAILLDAHLVVE